MFIFKRKLFSGYLIYVIFLAHVYIIKSEAKQADTKNSSAPHRIAIIGAGIGGTATAYFLNQLTGGHALIDVYESSRVGGRVGTVSFAGGQYEIGGIILFDSNKYMAQFVQEFGLSRITKDCSTSTGMFIGTETPFRISSWKIITLAKLLWRYGWSIYSMYKHNKDFLEKVINTYNLQKNGVAFRTTKDYLHAVHPSLPALMHTSTRQYFREKIGLSENIVEELVATATHNNYGQRTNAMNAFAGAISALTISHRMWHVAGGARRVPEQLLLRSGAKLLRRRATQVAVTGKNVNGKDVYQVRSVEPDNSSGGLHDLYTEGGYPRYRSSKQQEQHNDKDARVEGAEDELIKEYDAVIVATPLTADKSDLKFINTTNKFTFPGKYVRYVTTLVEGTRSKAVLNFTDTDIPDLALVINSDQIRISSIGQAVDFQDEQCHTDRPLAHMVTSLQPLTPEQLQLLFVEVKTSHVVDWRAFPQYEPGLNTAASFELQPGLYHNNAIEWMVSGMEVSAVAAKNAALLAHKHLTGDSSACSEPLNKNEL